MAPNSLTTKNPHNNIKFQINPFQLLKLNPSLKALSEPEFNPGGTAILNVSDYGFELTVFNEYTSAVGQLKLDAFHLLDFRCSKAILDKKIRIDLLSEFLLSVATDEFVTVVQADEISTAICFTCGYDHANALSVELLENTDTEDYKKFPDIKFTCETVLACSVLRDLINQLRKFEGSNLVSTFISEHKVIITIPQKNPYQYVIANNDVGFQAMVMTPGEESDAWFELHHLMSLVNASVAEPFSSFHLCFLTEQAGNIMIRFELCELGDLFFVQKAFHITQTVYGVVHPEEGVYVHVYSDVGLGFVHEQDLKLVGVLDITLCNSWADLCRTIHDMNPKQLDMHNPDPCMVWRGRQAKFDTDHLVDAFDPNVDVWSYAKHQITRVRLVPDDPDEDSEMETDLHELEV